MSKLATLDNELLVIYQSKYTHIVIILRLIAILISDGNILDTFPASFRYDSSSRLYEGRD